MTKLAISMQGLRLCLSMRRPLGTLIKDTGDVDTLFNDEEKDDKMASNENALNRLMP